MSKILLIEDDPVSQKAVELRLRKEGYEVVCCSDGREGIEKLRAELPDIVITDLLLPYTPGLEIVAAAKAITARRIRVVVVSGVGQEQVVEEAFNLGADDYITKPFSINEVALRIKKQFRGS